MTISRSDIVAEARSWLGTRFQHRGHAKGIGADCIGLVYGIASHFNLIPSEFTMPSYAPVPSNGLMMGNCRRFLPRRSQPLPGSIALMRFQHEPTHLAIFGDHPLHGLSLIHSYAQARRVVEHGFDQHWRERLVSVYDFPGVSFD
jgi:cell wall-associated NlpC family hydrolase